MKLVKFKMNDNYVFDLLFENGISKTVNLSSLIKSKINQEELKTAHIDEEWGCLEFKNGLVDISPKTLYNFTNRI